VSGRSLIVRSEAGFTLVEMLATIAILGIISLPLTNAFVVGLRSSDRTAKLLVTSADRQMLANYLPPDALSATGATTGAGTGCLGAAGTRVLLLTWTETIRISPPAVTKAYASDYRLVPAGTTNNLVRDRCDLGTAAEEVTVAHDATSATADAANLSITVTDSLGASYTVSGSRRAA
jgi:prepilin-type N-terminal cleavage/methylation domain-containing protein